MFYDKGASRISIEKGSHLTGFLHTKPTPKKNEYLIGFKKIIGSIFVPFTFLFSILKRDRKVDQIVYNKKGKKKFAVKQGRQDISAAIAEKMIVSMTPKHVNKKPKAIPKSVKKVAAIPVMTLLVFSAFFAMFAFNSPQYTIFLHDGNSFVAVRTEARDVKSFLIEQGIALGGEDKLSVSLDQATSDNLSITIKRAFPVTITTKEGKVTVELAEGTVKDALAKAEITIWQDDLVKPAMSTQLTSGMNITYQQVSYKYEEKTETVAYKTVKINNSTMLKGTTKVTQSGVNGAKTVKYKLVYVDGKLTGKEVINTIITKSAVNEIVAVGTKVKTTTTTSTTTTTTATGSNITISATAQAAGVTSSMVKKTISAETTAYTHTGYRTATGTWPKVGTVAVDPKLIPYGTKMYIEGYGFATAEDTGGFIKWSTGYAIDLFMETEAECIIYGRHHNTKVYILK